jgi:hypothetical protein
MKINLFVKIAVVLGGYAFAFLAAWGLSELEAYRASLVDPNAQGMIAEGEGITFLAVGGFLCLIPTALALWWFLPRSEKFWSFLSYALLALSLTAPLAEVCNFALKQLGLWQGWWAFAITIGLGRIFGTPIIALGDCLGAWISPFTKPRRVLLLAAAIEGITGFFVLALINLFQRFF